MAVVRVKRATKRDVWRVRWRDDNRRMRSKTFDRKADAEAFEAKVKLAKRNGSLEDLDAGKQTLKAFVDQWWRLYAEPNLAPATIKHYAALRDQYLSPRLGHYELRRLTPALIQRLQSDLARNGVGAATIRKLLALLQGILERAVEWGRLKTNPVKVVKKPAQRRTRIVGAVAPQTVEALRRKLLDAGKLRDATLVSVLAYAGLRPGEALALTWGDIGERTIIVDKALSLGEVTDTKTAGHGPFRC